jgi:hypothetical protein
MMVQISDDHFMTEITEPQGKLSMHMSYRYGVFPFPSLAFRVDSVAKSKPVYYAPKVLTREIICSNTVPWIP